MSIDNYNQKQIDRETMAEVRKCKRPVESLENKKKRYSEDTRLVKKAKKEINNINDAVDTILSSISELNDNQYAWSLGCDSTEKLFKNQINLPSNFINKLKNLSKLKDSLEPKWSINDLVVLDFFSLLKCENLVNTTLRIIDKKNQSVDIKTIIKTIKRIHVDHLTNFYIPENVLDRFCKNKHVKPTRPSTLRSRQSDHDIHIKFEIKLDPSFGKSSSKSAKLFSSFDTTPEKKKSSKKKNKANSRHRFKLQ